MGNLFLNSVTIKNYKCFKDETINFHTPDGSKVSGLNILIGENGTGKTTILEAINYITQSSYAIEGRLKINDFLDFNKPVEIHAETNTFKCSMPYKGNYFEANGLKLNIKSRDRKAPQKLLSAPFQINTYIKNIHEKYKNSKGEFSKEIKSIYKLYANDKIDDDEFNIFYFDKNRSRHLSGGAYKTIFDKICEDLNWKFLKNLDANNLDQIQKNISGEYFKNVLDISQKGTGAKLSSELSEFFDNNKQYTDLKIELLNILHPFSNAFFALRNESNLKQINISSLGSGVEIILTLLLLNSIYKNSTNDKGSIIYLLDEPELHLHPKAQSSLAELLLEESNDKQIIISTHSPYLYKNLLKNSGVITLVREENGVVEIKNRSSSNGSKLFPWSPSWGEINFEAYDMPTIEFHNELYGFIQENERKTNILGFDEFLNTTHNIEKNRIWINSKNNKEEQVTLQTYIRHSIHHPDNKLNKEYTDMELYFKKNRN